MARFFIDRPIFAWVIAIVIMLAGGLSISQLPLEQYPDIAPTRITISATYTGASAETIEDSVTQVIEQQMKGIDNLLYLSSVSRASGSARISLTFDTGTDPDVAQMQVQNKLQQAITQLPQEVQSRGLTVARTGEEWLLIASMVSADGSATATDVADFIASRLVDLISRIDGVGEVVPFGSAYAMRIWMDPAKLDKYALMPSDIRNAVLAQNTEVSAGQIGALPALPGQQLTATITARSKLQTAEEFRDIVVKATADGSAVLLGEVARVALGRDSYTVGLRYNGQPASGMGVRLATGANALAVAQDVKDKLEELEPTFPNRIEYDIAYDTTPFVRISIEEVVKTLIEAIVLVVLIMYLFLQNVRATLIPAIAVPVVLLGTFGVLAVFGYSINTLTMFGVVLAIGLLVDDAIVVVENVERLMSDKGLSAVDATRESMAEITGALVGIALVLSAVFVPMAFFGGATGVIYRQFSITIVSAMLLSVLVALTLTPALCATLLKPGHAPAGRVGPGKRFFGGFNRIFDRSADAYQRGVAGLLARGWRSLLLYLLLVGAMAFLYLRMPTSFLPDEDQGNLMAQINMPAGATDERLMKTTRLFESYLEEQDEVAGFITVTGLQGDQGTGRAFIKLADWSERTGDGEDAAALARRMTDELSTRIRDARVYVMQRPAVRGLGTSAGFELELQDQAGLGRQALKDAREEFLRLAAQRPEMRQVRTTANPDMPQFSIEIDDRKAQALGLSTEDINNTLSSAMGGSYINDFINQGRVKRVYMQADAPFRMQPDSIRSWYVRNADGEMVSFSTFATGGWTYGSSQLSRHNGASSYEIEGEAAPGVSTGVAMDAVEKIMERLPTGIGFEWTGQSYQERLSGSQAPMLYALSILFVFLCLAALYESWSVPVSVIMGVPLGILGAVLATTVAGLTNDVYFQVGLLTTVGLSAKNAILIVEFATQLQERGVDLKEATLQAARQRLRPILMTSLAFGFGVLPLALSSGAGSASRQAIGVGVFGGITAATVLGVLLVPLFFVWVRRLFAPKHRPVAERDLQSTPVRPSRH